MRYFELILGRFGVGLVWESEWCWVCPHSGVGIHVVGRLHRHPKFVCLILGIHGICHHCRWLLGVVWVWHDVKHDIFVHAEYIVHDTRAS